MIFQFTASQGGWRPVPIVLHRDWIHFNSQPHKEADYNAVQMLRQVEHFNSQPHKEADWPHGRYTTDSQSISIHSLTRRLTIYECGCSDCSSISIHSLTRRLTIADTPFWTPVVSISIHSLTRRLTRWHLRAYLMILISIHSLTRRLTTDWTLCSRKELFQFTASQGGWRGQYSSLRTWEIFQFTASQGGWQHKRSGCFYCERISIHSLTRRLTILWHLEYHFLHISIHSLTRRLTFAQAYRSKKFIFQFTASQGGWHLSWSVLQVSLKISIHSLTRRLTCYKCWSLSKGDISIHSLTRRLTAEYPTAPY